VRDVSAEVFAANDVPAAAQLAVQLPLYYACHLAVLLRLEDALHVSHLLDRRVRHADDRALLLGLHVGVADEDFLGAAALLLALPLVFILVAHCITYAGKYINTVDQVASFLRLHHLLLLALHSMLAGAVNLPQQQ
jgi:hypothetical protein